MVDLLFYKTPNGEEIHYTPVYNTVNSFLNNWEFDTTINGIEYHFLFNANGKEKDRWLKRQADGAYLPCPNIEIVKLEHVVVIE